MLSIDQAVTELKRAVKAVTDVDTVPLSNALGRVSAVPICSGLNVPPTDVSAMDGYAIRVEDLDKNKQVRLAVSQRIPAGFSAQRLASDTTARIFTGGEIPPGANAVVMQEDCTRDGDFVRLPANVEMGRNIRSMGQDIKTKDIIVEAGSRLQAQHLGIIASVGASSVKVVRRLKIAILSTGDELVEPGNPLQKGQIYNSNRYTLAALLETAGFEVVDLGIVPDNRELTVAALSRAAEQADVILSCGGVSVGEEDHVRPAVEQLGHIDLWRLAIKPGKPLAFGNVNQKYFFGLPGNPVSVFVTFLVVVRPFLIAMQSGSWPEVCSMRFPAQFARINSSQRQEYLRIQVQRNGDGEQVLREFSSQDSGVMSSTVWANALAIIPAGVEVKKGDLLDALLYEHLIN